jgi:hypothetical protein
VNMGIDETPKLGSRSTFFRLFGAGVGIHGQQYSHLFSMRQEDYHGKLCGS